MAHARAGEMMTKPGPSVPGEPVPAPQPKRPPRARPWVAAATYAYALVVLVCLALIRWVGEDWWGVTALLFAPRWLFLAPPVCLALLAAWVQKPSLWLMQGATAIVVAGPLMAFTLPVARLQGPPADGEQFRVMTYNLGEHGIDARGLTQLLDRERIDLVCFQEGPRNEPVLKEFFAQGWHRDRGNFIASRYPIVREIEPLPEEFLPEDRFAAKLHGAIIRAPSGREFLLVSLHMPTLRPGLNRLLNRNVEGLEIHVEWWRREIDRVLSWLDRWREMPLVLAGDFNMPPDDSTMAALRATYRFAFEEAGWGYGYTRPTRTPWFRIDHIATTPEWDVARCWVGNDFGSDHLPLIADIVLPPSAPR